MATVLPKDISKLGQEVKLFGKWETQECVLLLLLCHPFLELGRVYVIPIRGPIRNVIKCWRLSVR